MLQISILVCFLIYRMGIGRSKKAQFHQRCRWWPRSDKSRCRYLFIICMLLPVCYASDIGFGGHKALLMSTSLYVPNLMEPSWSWVRIPLMARCTRYNIMWYNLSVACDKSVVFSRYSGSLHQYNWTPRYNWNIVERGAKHHNPQFGFRSIIEVSFTLSIFYCQTNTDNESDTS